MKYYFFTEKSFTEKDFGSVGDAVAHAEQSKNVVKVVASKGSEVVWTKEKAVK
jgi:hypothetical protein